MLAANPAIVAEFRAGKEKAFNALVGKAMAATKGKANPAQVNAILKRKLATLRRSHARGATIAGDVGVVAACAQPHVTRPPDRPEPAPLRRRLAT